MMRSICIIEHHRRSSLMVERTCRDVLQKYLEKIKTLHKSTSSYHTRTNGEDRTIEWYCWHNAWKMLGMLGNRHMLVYIYRLPQHHRHQSNLSSLALSTHPSNRKLLLNKPTKLWDLYLDQAVFALG